MGFGGTIAGLLSAFPRNAPPNMLSDTSVCVYVEKAHAPSNLSPLSILLLLTISTLEEALAHIVLTKQLSVFHFRLWEHSLGGMPVWRK